MYKVAGSVKYPWIAVSPSDPTKAGLGFMFEDQASKHAASMNDALSEFESPSWNKDSWKTKPEPWIVIYNPDSRLG